MLTYQSASVRMPTKDTEMDQTSKSMGAIILFDGDCFLCNNFVQFVIARDPTKVFKFSAQQSSFSQQLIISLNIQESLKDAGTIVLVEGNQYFVESQAVLRIIGNLSGPVKLLSVMRFIPMFIRDRVYRFIARNRHRFFKSKDRCLLMSDDLKKRLIN